MGLNTCRIVGPVLGEGNLRIEQAWPTFAMAKCASKGGKVQHSLGSSCFPIMTNYVAVSVENRHAIVTF